MIGTWMQMFAQGWVLTSLTPSAFVLGALNFTSGLPMLLLSLKGGSVADRFDKRVILHSVLLVQMLSAACIGWLVGHEAIRIWHLFAAAMVLGIAAAFEVPAVSAFVPELVPREDMAGAIAADRSVFHATRLLGPALGGYLVGHFGASTAYYANSASFLALIVALLTISRRRRAEPAEGEEEASSGMMAGVHYVRRDEPMRAMVLLIAAMTLFVSPFLVITMPYYTRVVLGFGAEKMGLIMGVSGIGSLAGSLGLLSIRHGHRARALKMAASAVVLAMIGMATAYSFQWAAGSLILLTIGLSVCFGLSNIVIQERAPDVLRGRISAVSGLAFFGLLPFSGLLISWLVDWAGMRQTLAWCAGGFAIATATLLLGRKQLATAPVTVAVPETA